MTTNTTALCRRTPFTDFQDSTYPLLCLPFEFPYELTEGEVRDLFAPQTFHTFKVQVFKEHYIKITAEIYCKFPVVIRSLIRSFLMDTRNLFPTAFLVVRTFQFTGVCLLCFC